MDQDLIALDLRLGDVLDDEDLETAMLMDADSFH